MTKGDYVDITYRSGNSIHTVRVQAEKSGRRVEVESGKEHNIAWIEAKEVTRGGTVVRSKKVAALEVLAIEVEQKEMA